MLWMLGRGHVSAQPAADGGSPERARLTLVQELCVTRSYDPAAFSGLLQIELQSLRVELEQAQSFEALGASDPGLAIVRVGCEAASSGDSDFTWQFDHDGTSERLVAHKQADKVTGIALAAAGERTFFDELDATAHQLTPVDSASLAHFAVRNLAGDVEVEFVADVQNGARIVVTRPKDDWTYDDFRVFYGMNGQLIERVTTFSGARSYRAFDFIVDGAKWHVAFGSSLAPDIESAVDTGAAMFPLTLIQPPVPVPGDMFECIVHE
jgi:hypothetical protein